MEDLLLAFAVICNSISVIFLLFQIRRLRREKGLSVGDLKAANRLQDFLESKDSPGLFGEYVSRVYGESPHYIAGDSVNSFKEVSGYYNEVHLED